MSGNYLGKKVETVDIRQENQLKMSVLYIALSMIMTKKLMAHFDFFSA